MEASETSEATGASLGDAKWAAMKELQARFPGLRDGDVSFEVLEEAGDEVRVRATADTEALGERGFELPDDPPERVRLILERILLGLDLRGSVDIETDEEAINARISGGEDLTLLIGRQGQTIDAIQLLCYQAAFRGMRERKRVSVDAAGYRERRTLALERQAEEAAEQTKRSGRRVELEAMTAQERRIVHTHLRDLPGVESFSEGEEPRRFIVVAPLLGE